MFGKIVGSFMVNFFEILRFSQFFERRKLGEKRAFYVKILLFFKDLKREFNER